MAERHGNETEIASGMIRNKRVEELPLNLGRRSRRPPQQEPKPDSQDPLGFWPAGVPMPEWPQSPSVPPESLVEPGDVALGRVAHWLRWYYDLIVGVSFRPGVPNHLQLEPRPLMGWDGIVVTPAARGPSIWIEIARSCLRHRVAPEVLVERMCRPTGDQSFAPSPEDLLLDEMTAEQVQEIQVLSYRRMGMRASSAPRRFQADYNYFRYVNHDSENAIVRAINAVKGPATKDYSAVYRFGIAWRLNRPEPIRRLFRLAALEFACEFSFWHHFATLPYVTTLALQYDALLRFSQTNVSDRWRASKNAQDIGTRGLS